MAFTNPADRALLRLEMRRYVTRCENTAGLLQRADSLREVARLGSSPMPYQLANEVEAREAEHRLHLATEDRAKEIIMAQIGAYAKADPDHRSGMRSRMLEEWTTLSGPLTYLRSWAKGKLTLAEQAL